MKKEDGVLRSGDIVWELENETPGSSVGDKIVHEGKNPKTGERREVLASTQKSYALCRRKIIFQALLSP